MLFMSITTNSNKFKHTFHFDQITKCLFIVLDNNSDDDDDIFDESSNSVNCCDYIFVIYNIIKLNNVNHRYENCFF